MKYFKEKIENEMTLSEYSKSPRTGRDKEYAEYIIEEIGDITLPKDKLECFCEYLRFTGRYDNRFEKETLEEIHKIMVRFPMLSKDAVYELSSYYIKDLFSDGEILSTLDKLIKVFGSSDEMFKIFMIYVEEKAKMLDEEYIKESEKLDSLEDEYSENFIKHLKYSMKRKHIKLDRILESLPSSELIKKDEEHLLEIAYRTRIYMGMCNPVSYKYFDKYLEDKTLETMSEEPKYYINLGGTREEKATFTKTEFLKGMKKGIVKLKK